MLTGNLTNGERGHARYPRAHAPPRKKYVTKRGLSSVTVRGRELASIAVGKRGHNLAVHKRGLAGITRV